MILVRKRARKAPFTLLAGALLAVLSIAFVAPSVLAQVPTPPAGDQASGVSVVGEGVVAVPPSAARVVLGVEVSDLSLAKAQTDAAARMTAIVEFLKSSGIEERDIHTVSFNIHPVYEPKGENEQGLRGYVVENLVEVRTRNIDGLGELLDQTVAHGATRVAGVHFEAEDQREAMDEARTAAVQDARERAEHLARATGVALGQTVYVEELGTGPFSYGEVMHKGASGAQTPIQPGLVQVRAAVRVTWAIQ